jgi:hypothetical protein
MKLLKTSLILTLMVHSLHAYQDKDLDGIDDKMDLCPNTTFDAKVDKFGCAVKSLQTPSTKKQHFTIGIGTTLRKDDRYEDDSSFNFFANYQRYNWNFSLSNIHSTTNSDYTQDNTEDNGDDLYISAGYTTYLPKAMLKFSLGSKIASDDRDDDYYLSSSVDFFVNKKQDIFLYYSYTLSGDSDSYDYEDYSSFSIGSGYQIVPSWYSAFSYSYADSIYDGGEAQESITWYNSYKINQKVFLTGSYSYALDDLSFEDSFTFSVGMRF